MSSQVSVREREGNSHTRWVVTVVSAAVVSLAAWGLAQQAAVIDERIREVRTKAEQMSILYAEVQILKAETQGLGKKIDRMESKLDRLMDERR